MTFNIRSVLPKESGYHFRDPRLFLPIHVSGNSFRGWSETSGAMVSSGGGTFFSEFINENGTYVDSNFDADTFKTILSITGAGVVYAIIGPRHPNANNTTTFEVTVDGVLKTFTVTGNGVNSAWRSALVRGVARQDTVFTTSGHIFASGGTFNAGKTVQYGGNQIAFLSLASLEMMGTPGLQFDDSLLIRIKHSVNVTDPLSGGNAGRTSGVIHRTFQ